MKRDSNNTCFHQDSVHPKVMQNELEFILYRAQRTNVNM